MISANVRNSLSLLQEESCLMQNENYTSFLLSFVECLYFYFPSLPTPTYQSSISRCLGSNPPLRKASHLNHFHATSFLLSDEMDAEVSQLNYFSETHVWYAHISSLIPVAYEFLYLIWSGKFSHYLPHLPVTVLQRDWLSLTGYYCWRRSISIQAKGNGQEALENEQWRLSWVWIMSHLLGNLTQNGGQNDMLRFHPWKRSLCLYSGEWKYCGWNLKMNLEPFISQVQFPFPVYSCLGYILCS